MHIKQQKYLLYFISVTFIITIFVIIGLFLSNNKIKRISWDTTEDKLYSISQNSKNIITNLDENITLYFFMSSSNKNGRFKDYAQRIKTILEQYVKLANGKIKLEIIDPVPFSEDEEMALNFSINQVFIDNQPVYLGLAAKSEHNNQVQVLRFFEPDKERFLEYDITNLIYKTNLGRALKIGVITNIPLAGATEKSTGKKIAGLYIYNYLNQLYDIEFIDLVKPQINNNLDLLLVAVVDDVDDELVYAIEQYGFNGGKIIFLEDPAVNSFGYGSISNKIIQLTANWGLAINKSFIIADLNNAQSVVLKEKNIRHLGVFSSINDTKLNSTPITQNIDQVIFSSAGAIFMTRAASEQQAEILLSSSNNAYLVNKSNFDNLIEGNLGQFLKQSIKSPDNGFPIAVTTKIKNVTTMFATRQLSNTKHLDEAHNIQYIVIADMDFLFDNFWLAKSSKGNVTVANNSNLILNSIDFLTGNDDLIAIRGKGEYFRNFTTIEKILTETENKLFHQENILKQELEQVERQINDIQKDGRDQNLILTEEQQRAVEQFRIKRYQIVTELRKTKKQLNDSLASIEKWLKFFNIWFIPLLICILLLSSIFIKKYSGIKFKRLNKNPNKD